MHKFWLTVQIGQLLTMISLLDNPASDILGANQYESPRGSSWESILVRSGVYNGGEPAEKPSVVVDDVLEAVRWAVKKEGLDVNLEG